MAAEIKAVACAIMVLAGCVAWLPVGSEKYSELAKTLSAFIGLGWFIYWTCQTVKYLGK